MRVERCTEAHRSDWNLFVSASAAASFYHRFEWQEINRLCFGHSSCYLGVYDDHDVLTGVFPVVHVKSRLFGDLACSMPFVNYGGPCATSEEAEHRLLDEARCVAEEWDVEFLEIRSRHHLGPEFPTSEHKVSMTVELDREPDLLWRAFKTDHRRDIRRGYKRGFVARFGQADLLDDFYAVLAEAWRDMGTPIYRKRYLQAVVAAFPAHARLCVVYDGREPAAASFQAYHGDTAEGLWLGTRARYRDQFAGYVLYWEILKDAAGYGCRRFHLGRSTVQSGGETFKRKWNATPNQLYWQYVLRRRTDMPRINVTNPKYQLAMWAWRHLPVALTTRVGPPIAGGIP